MVEVLYTAEEVAEHFKTSPRTVRDWIRQKKLTGIKIGKEWRFSEKDIEDAKNRFREAGIKD